MIMLIDGFDESSSLSSPQVVVIVVAGCRCRYSVVVGSFVAVCSS
jgi:hypothetical protein